MRKAIASILIGVTGGIGFTWVLNHVPAALAMVLAAMASLQMFSWMLYLFRTMRKHDEDLKFSRAQIERIAQSGNSRG